MRCRETETEVDYGKLQYSIPNPCLADYATQDACVSSKRVKNATQKTKNK